MGRCCFHHFFLHPLALLLTLGLVSALGAPPAGAGDASVTSPATSAPAQSAGHSAHGESFNEGPRSPAYLMAGTGNVHFPVTCNSVEAQKFFDQGIGQLHGFWDFEAERSFRQAAAIDPNCAMAYWGMALANINNSKRAADFIKEAEQRKASVKLKPIEVAWIDALSALYREPPKDKKEREKKLVATLKDMRKDFPDDVELKAFLAFYIWEFHVTKENATADKLLDEIFAVAPHHPAHHYRIHLLDTRNPKGALASAAQCGPAVPGIAHMWHMPGHIYSDLNRYTDAVWQQEAGARVDHAYMIHDRVMPFQIFNYMHNSEWLCRDLLFVGRAHDALALAKNMIDLPRHPTRGNGLFYGTARAIDTLSQHQMWEEVCRAVRDGTLRDDLDADQLTRKLRYEGVANAAMKHGDAADRCIARLQDQRKALPPPTTQPATQPTTQPAKVSPKRRKKKEAAALADPAPASALVPAPALIASTQPALAEIDAPDFTLCATATSTAPAPGASTKPATKGTVPWSNPAKASATTRPASKVAATTRPTSQPATTRPSARQPAPAVDRVAADRRAAIDQAIDHINAEKAMVAGDFKKAAALFTSANARKEHIALAYLAANNFAKAEELVKQAVTEGKEQTYPLAMQVLVLHREGKKTEAAKAFEMLRKLAYAVDLTVEPYKTLCGIAPEYGYKPDFRIARALPADLGPRPPLDSLGPFRWHPSPAPNWTAHASDGSPVSLSQYRGKPVIVLFYLGHGCPHCVKQIHDFAAMSGPFTAAGISLVAIGTDAPNALGKTWATAGPTPAFPLASDGTLEIFKTYHCYDAFEKMPLHGTFLIDAQGLIRWQDISYEPFLDPAYLLKEAKRLIGQPEQADREAPTSPFSKPAGK